MNPDVAHLADRIVAAAFAREPLEAALLGLSQGSAGLADLTEAHEYQLAATYELIAVDARELQGQVENGSVTLDELDRLTLDLVALSATTAAESVKVPLVGFTVTDLFNAPLSGLISVLPMLPLDTPERRGAQLSRFEAVPSFLEQAAQRHRDAIDRGLTPTARGVRAAMAQVEHVVSDPSVSAIRRGASDGLDADYLAAQDRLLDEAVVPAMRAYREVLEREVLDHGRGDEQPGLSWLPGGDEMYRHLVRASTSTDRTAQDLHDTGLAILERLNDEFAALGRALWGIGGVEEIHERLRTDPALRYDSSEEIVATAVAAVRRAEAEAPNWFGELPASACAVEPVPDAIAAGSPPAYYFTGALDGSRAGTYFINATKPQERFRHQAEAVAYHEAVPGHHFQLTIAQELAATHVVHAVLGDVATAEGWGLYAERLADEMGLYSDDVARLGMVSTDAWRAARLVVDTGLHAFGWSRQRAIDFMAAHVPMSQIEIESEVDRYIAVPGQALAYMVGRLELESLRRRAAEHLGERFDVRDFHDLILRCGPVPLAALSAAVDRWLARS
jgi:uncharacterized protein (DUF885 family)